MRVPMRSLASTRCSVSFASYALYRPGADATLPGTTKNKLFIPITYQADDLKITLKGESVVKVKGKADGATWRYVFLECTINALCS